MQNLAEIKKVAELEGVQFTDEQVLSLYMAQCMEAAKDDLLEMVDISRSIERESELLKHLLIVAETAQALLEIRHELLYMI